MTDQLGSVATTHIMTEVSNVRSQPERTPRPLGEVKESVIFFDTYNKTQRHVGHEKDQTKKRKAEYSFRRMKEMRESLRQAALINIVAAVNESTDSSKKVDKNNNIQPLSKSADTISNTMTVLSNLMLNRDRTISIPKPQVFNEAPQTLSGKKPLYFKNSRHAASVSEIEERKRHIYLTRTRRPKLYRPEPEEKNNLDDFPISVTIQHKKGDDNKDDQSSSREWINSPTRVRIARSMTSRRRFASWKKKQENRIGTAASLSKCEAVDIMDPSDTFSNASLYPESLPATRERLLTGSPRPKSYPDTETYRGKSLPALFPVKKKKFQDSPQILTSNEKVKIASPFKHHTVNVYGGISLPSTSLGSKPLQMKTGHLALGSTVSGKNYQESKRSTSRQDNENQGEVIIVKRVDPGISLSGRSMDLGSHPPSATSGERDRPRSYQTIERALDDEREMVQDMDSKFDEIHRKISSRIADWSERKPHKNLNSVSAYNLVGKGFKSSLSSAKSKDTGSTKAQKRVQFADNFEEADDDVSVFDDIKSIGSAQMMDDNDTSVIRAQGVANKFHLPTKPLKPTTASDLLRLRNRLMPSNFNQVPTTRRVLLDNFRISRLRSKGSAKSDKRSWVTETEIGGYENNITNAWDDLDATDRTSSTVPKSYGMSSFYPDKRYDELSDREKAAMKELEKDDDEGNDDEEDIEMENESDDDEDNDYKVVKAVDLAGLSGYQHRKFKKPESNSEPAKTHFVKVKMK